MNTNGHISRHSITEPDELIDDYYLEEEQRNTDLVECLAWLFITTVAGLIGWGLINLIF